MVNNTIHELHSSIRDGGGLVSLLTFFGQSCWLSSPPFQCLLWAGFGPGLSPPPTGVAGFAHLRRLPRDPFMQSVEHLQG